MKKLNLVGQKYNRLTVLKESKPINGRTTWECKCDCGNIKIIKTEELRSNGTKSCGCLNDDKRSVRAENMYSKNVKYEPIEASARRVWRSRYREISFEDFIELSQLNCFYCKSLPSNNQNGSDKKSSNNMKENGNFIYNGLDRIDNSLPHTKENCVPCCKWCNFSKRERTTAEFIEWINRVYNTINSQ